VDEICLLIHSSKADGMGSSQHVTERASTKKIFGYYRTYTPYCGACFMSVCSCRGARDAEPVLAALSGLPADTRLQPHGLYLSNASDSLYVGRMLHGIYVYCKGCTKMYNNWKLKRSFIVLVVEST
jgi:hypothetical protein